MNKKIVKRLMFILIITVFLFGFSYAFFTFNDEGKKNKIVVGKVHLNYLTESSFSAQDISPRGSYDPDVYTEFTISGLNEYDKKDIWYGIKLLYGEVPEGKNESNRINDSFLRFRLTKKINNLQETVVFNNLKMDDIDDQIISQTVVPAETMDELVHTYKLYVWVSNDVDIGNTSSADYTLEEWNNIFASIKVKVEGNLIAKDSLASIRVNFDNDGGFSNTPYKYYEENSLYGELPTPTRTGYIFDGYWTSDILDVHQLSSYAINEGIAIDENGYVYDTTPESDSRPSWRQQWEVDATPGIYRIYINFIEPSTYHDESNPDNPVSPSVRVSQLINDERVDVISTNILNTSIIDRTFEINDSTKLMITLRIFDGVADVKLYRKVGNNETLVLNDDHTLKAFWIPKRYEYNGEYTFTGSNYINTGVQLFSPLMYQKNFHISFDITEIGQLANQDTIMNSKFENGTTWPGFVFRKQTNNEYFEISSTVSYPNNRLTLEGFSYSTTNVDILRVDNNIYYSLGVGEDGAEYYPLQSYDGFSDFFREPVTFGATLVSGVPNRFFTGKLANLLVEILDDDVDIGDYNIHQDVVNESYSLNSSLVFNGSNYVDTGIKLFNEENIHRDFSISFDLKSTTDSSNTGSVVSTLDHSSIAGVRLKRSGNYTYDTAANLNTNYSDIGRFDNIYNVRIVRIDDIIYYSYNYTDFVQMGSVANNTNYSDIPLVFGANYIGVNSYDGFFKGEIANIDVHFLENNETLSDFPVTNTSESFQYTGQYVFNGHNYIDTGVKVFNNSTNVAKDLYISCEIIADNSADGDATIFSAKNELVKTVWPGFDFRHNSKSGYDATKYYLKATVNNSSGSGNVPAVEKSNDVSSTSKIEILRKDSILYYSFNGGSFKVLQDYTSFDASNYFDQPVFIGAGISNSSGVMRRFFIGTLSNITVKFLSSAEVSAFQSRLPS